MNEQDQEVFEEAAQKAGYSTRRYPQDDRLYAEHDTRCMFDGYMAGLAHRDALIAEPEDDTQQLQIRAYYEGGEPFICGVRGDATIEALKEMEAIMIANAGEMFTSGDGDYVFNARHCDGQRSFPETGQWDFPPYWEFERVGFEAAAAAGEGVV